ncbi:short-chain dehydrogenase [Bifidobacterium pullorum subsp. saeculare DSM 6531 = LMG 14934]|uniref:Short-chain dehydrogenase n=1 Tax=Bifidobacterium pullorum subsp. saeculare DSM 6531 = LMG 14934 TaxID=1437611 RepID=A0A087D157_9BIFI|nr:SDR family oxidoreductase [Bifidobacterium pullorum]KFI89257.1 short-chain dehydrogenase [Bifidobacterium pullorum subsp. saeculare DSM 6531 = LMG 14934]
MKANQYYAGACVVITGAGSGIGRLMALRIVEEGGRVAIWDINGEAARTTADMANAQVGADPSDPKAIAFTVDVTDNAAVQQAAADTIDALGRVNVLINNAGVVSGAPFEDLTEQQIRRTFAVNVLSLFWTTKAFMPALKKQQRAAIVTVASAAGIVAVARQTDYAASKFAAVGFTSSLRSELKKAGSHIRTLTVCPYYIDTGMFEGVTTKFPLLLPILKEQAVTDRIVEAVAKGRERLIMPPFAAVAGFVAALPPKIADPIYGIFGLNEGMDHFTGRK